MLFRYLMRSAVRKGTVRLTDSQGRTFTFGDRQKPEISVKLHDASLDWTLAIHPALSIAEAYMDGRLTIEQGKLDDFIEITALNYPYLQRHWLARIAFLLAKQTRWAKQHNPIGKAQANVAHHYDLSGELYDLFLDADRQYSCAYFQDPSDDLELAQENKKRHIAAKLHLDRPGLRVLDIGAGWGGLGLYLAQAADCEVTGVTLSREQHKVSVDRAKAQGLEGRVRFHLRDYREDQQAYDRVVSVGMFEHVGKRNYAEFFSKLGRLLKDDGVCLLHSIGRLDRPGPISPFMRKYIFPGADLPTLSEATAAIERSGLLITDVEILRLHYAETLRHWHDRFQANREKVQRLYDERFCRMWELYLKGCEFAFRLQGLMVFQIQLTKRLDTLPLTRDYMVDWERRKLGSAQAQAAE